jgi:hypothetical protein
VCWSLLEELDDPIIKGFPFKILTVYQDDYKENHKLIYGNEIVDLIPSLNQREMIRIRAKSYHKLAAQRIETTILKVISGEVIRYMALIHGALSIRKKETYRLMKELADDDALTILKEYHEGREMGHPDEFYYNFIETRSKKIFEELDIGGTV